MYVPYHTLPDNARVWVYQSNREFTDTEIDLIASRTTEFVEQWTRHGENVRGSFTIVHQRFLIVAVDQDFMEVSGCSIDASVKLVQQLQAELQVDMLDKLAIAYKNNKEVTITTLAEFGKKVKNKEINANTIVFNNMVNTKIGVETQWEVPAKESWHARYFN
ncbi:ABC transporter ATPase [Wenyingzhuangia sp. IMCC45533]